jgi:hypothetical protein
LAQKKLNLLDLWPVGEGQPLAFVVIEHMRLVLFSSDHFNGKSQGTGYG